MQKRWISLLAMLLVVGVLPACRSAGPDASRGIESPWESLFDGRSLAGWKASENPASWTVEDGTLVAHGERSHLFYIGDGAHNVFRDFEFEAEVMTRKGSNSGIYFHTEYQADGWPRKGVEAQINNTQAKDPRRTGSLYGIVDLHESPVGDDQWWTYTIMVQDKHVVVKLNGETVVDYVEPDDVTGGRQLSQGTFALQGHDRESVVFFRNIRVRRLSVESGADAVEVKPAQMPADPYAHLAGYQEGESRVALTAIETQLSQATPEQLPALEDRLLSVLASPESTAASTQFVCRMLQRFGSVRSVPVLAGLLADAGASHMARYVLERMPFPEARDALRDALAAASGDQLSGLIDSLGASGDVLSVPLLAAHLGADDRMVAGAAATALGRIGDAKCTELLRGALGRADDQFGMAVADALLRCSEQLARDGDAKAALELYESLYLPELPVLVRTAALDGQVRVAGERAIPLLIQVMSGDDVAMQTLAAQYVRDLPGTGLTAAFAAQLPKMAPSARTVLLSALGERRDPAARPAVIAALQADREEVRLAALAALQTIGDSADIEMLARFAAQTHGTERATACSTLSQLRGDNVDQSLLALLGHTEPGVRAVGVEALALRRSVGTLEAVLDACRDPADVVRLAAAAALSDLGDLETVPRIIKQLVDSQGDTERRRAQETLTAICTRDDKVGAGANMLTAAYVSAAGVPVRVALLRVLGNVGGDTALWAVTEALEDSEPAVVDAAVRALCDWPDAAALEALLALASEADQQVHRILALRAALRLMAACERREASELVAVYERALKLADRAEERKLALAGLAELGVPEAMALVTPYLADVEVRTEAAIALATLARLTVGHDVAQARAMAERAMAVSDHRAVREEAETALKVADGMSGYLMQWQVSGPYTFGRAENKVLMARRFPPEAPDAAEVEWRPLPVGLDPEKPWALDLQAALGGEYRVAYLRTHVFTSATRHGTMAVGSDDGIKVWVNGRVVHSNPADRGLAAAEDSIPITLHPGWNRLLLKVSQGVGDWGACAQLVDDDGRAFADLRVASALTDEQRDDLVDSLPAELVLSWQMAEEEGAELRDSSGHGSGGVIEGDAERVSGLWGRCLRFDGVDDVVKSSPHLCLPAGADDPWSMNMYVFIEKQPEELTILGGFGDVVSGRPVGCQRYLVKYKGGIHFWGSSVDVNAGVPFDVGRWQMVTSTYDGTTVTIYKDGKALISSAETLADAEPMATLGHLDHWGKDTRFAGKLDDFTIWYGVLTQVQIDELAGRLEQPVKDTDAQSEDGSNGRKATADE